MLPLSTVLGVLGVSALLVYYVRRSRHRSVRNIRGPRNPSFFFGNMLDLWHQAEAGGIEYEWFSKYGDVIKIGGCYGEEILFVADPKALHYILHVAAYRFPRIREMIQQIRLFMGKGLFWASGDIHKRQKKVMNPAFQLNRMRAFVPLFHNSATKLVDKWREEVGEKGNTLNVIKGISNVGLDTIGQVAFGFHFGALDGNGDSELSKALHYIFVDCMLSPPKSMLLVKPIWRYIPSNMMRWMELLPMEQVRSLRNFLVVTQRSAKNILHQMGGNTKDEGKDILSILVQANSAEDAKRRLDEEEILGQMSTVMLAGHDAALSLAWLFLDLAKCPEDQQRIRDEIRAVRAQSETPDAFSVADLDAMTYTNAVIKESLRLNPPASGIGREAGQDEVLPLATPLRTATGEEITEIPIAKGQPLYLSIATYNKLTSVWGPDANEWNPRRFLSESKDKQFLGLFGNLMTFSGGIHGCIGWRFAVLELLCFLVGTIEHLEFGLPPPGIQIVRAPAGSTIPLIRGREREGPQMPLRVSPLKVA